MVSDILINTGSGNGMWPVRRQVMTGTTADLLSIGPQGKNFREISSNVFWKLKMSAKHQHFCHASMCQYWDIYSTAAHCVNCHADDFTLVSLWCSSIKLSITRYFGVGDILAGARNFICNLLRHKQRSTCSDTTSKCPVSCFMLFTTRSAAVDEGNLMQNMGVNSKWLTTNIPGADFLRGFYSDNTCQYLIRQLKCYELDLIWSKWLLNIILYIWHLYSSILTAALMLLWLNEETAFYEHFVVDFERGPGTGIGGIPSSFWNVDKIEFIFVKLSLAMIIVVLVSMIMNITFNFVAQKVQCIAMIILTLQWRHNGHDGVSNHQPHDWLPNRLFRRRSKKTSKLRVTGLCAGNSPVTGEFPTQMASNEENVSTWWRQHGVWAQPMKDGVTM